MKISYNWLKWYIPDVPEADKLRDIFTYHLCEVEGIEKREDGDTIFDINILPNRAHDLLSHQGIARELASLLGIVYNDPTPKYKVPESKPTDLKIEIKSDRCRRYSGRIIRNVKVGPSPEWVVNHLEAIGQRSINNVVDASNIVMYDSGQPTHCFDLDKVEGEIIIREAKEGEELTTLDNKQVKLKTTDLVIADSKKVLAIAGVKGGKVAEVDADTKNIIIEVANFEPVSVRKTRRSAGIFTDAVKRFENDLSPELCDFAMLEISGLMAEYGFTEFEDVVDVYPNKQEARTLSFSAERMSKILGREVPVQEVEDVLKRYVFEYVYKDGMFTITVPSLRLDLEIEEDMAEEIGRILGYDKVKSQIPKINFKSQSNGTFEKIKLAREGLLGAGYSEVMTYAFCSKGEVQVLESASDKKFLRTNLSDGLKESLKLNKLNSPLLGVNEVKIFEIGTVFNKDGEEVRVAYNEKDKIIEMPLGDFHGEASPDTFSQVLGKNPQTGSKKHTGSAFTMWSLFPFIARDVSVWVPEGETPDELKQLITKNATELSVTEPLIFDSFTKEGKTSYAFRLVFQSHERTLTDAEVNKIMENISEKIKENPNWQIR